MGKIRLLKLTVFSSLLFTFLSSITYAETTLQEGWDELWRELMIDVGVIGVIFAIVTLYLMIRYRRKRPDETGSAPKLSPIAAFGWVLIPLFVFMADDIYMGLKNWNLWNEYRDVPQDAYSVDVTAFLWGFEIKYPEGVTTQNELRVPVGKPIHVKLTSRDTIHTFFLPDFRVKWDALPGRVQSLWFRPTKVGEHVFTCTEYCGLLHSRMFGKLIVMEEDEFSRWLAENKSPKEDELSDKDAGKEEKTENVNPLKGGKI